MPIRPGAVAPPGSKADAVNAAVDDNYKVKLFTADNSVNVEANLPERFSLQLTSNWDDPLNTSVGEYMSKGLAMAGGAAKNQRGAAIAGGASVGVAIASKVAQQATGLTTQHTALSCLVWQSGSHLEIDIPFVFKAKTNPKKDVTKVVQDLMKLVAPSIWGGSFIRAPGPTPAAMALNNAAGTDLNAGEIITLQLGNFIKLCPVVVQSVNSEFDTQFDRNGDPISVTVTVNCKTYYTVTDELLDEIFMSIAGGNLGEEDNGGLAMPPVPQGSNFAGNGGNIFNTMLGWI